MAEAIIICCGEYLKRELKNNPKLQQKRLYMEAPVVVRQYINASPEKIWTLLTDKEQMKLWYFDIPDFEPGEGRVFNFYEPGTQKKFHHRCTILEWQPGMRLRHTWTYPARSKGISVVTWDILADGDGASVSVTHEGIEQFKDGGKDFVRESFEAGWKEILGTCLKDFAENGKSVNV
jgi:uncharacterized protein YndB with AHSA1/START domain